MTDPLDAILDSLADVIVSWIRWAWLVGFVMGAIAGWIMKLLLDERRLK